MLKLSKLHDITGANLIYTKFQLDMLKNPPYLKGSEIQIQIKLLNTRWLYLHTFRLFYVSSQIVRQLRMNNLSNIDATLNKDDEFF